MYKNILIMKPGAIGDLVQLVPVIHALRNRYPEALITLLVGSSASAGLFSYNSDVHATIIFDRKKDHRSFWSFLHLWLALRKKKYDLIVNFQRSNLKIWLLAAAAFPCRVLTYHKTADRSVHAVENHLRTLAPLGIGSRASMVRLSVGPENTEFASTIVSTHAGRRFLVALNPGASHRVNRWSTASFVALSDLLADRLSVTILIIGGTEDRPLAEEIAAGMKSQPLVMTGKTTLLQTAALLEQSAVLVTGDTGPMHLAAAVGTPVVALFGAADPTRTGPLGSGHRVLQAEGLECVPCRERKCRNRQYLQCMELITPESVFNAVAEILEKKRETGG